MKVTIKDLHELRKIKGITKRKMQEKGLHLQTYLNMTRGINKPTTKVISGFCDLFEINEKEFKRLLSKTIPKG